MEKKDNKYSVLNTTFSFITGKLITLTLFNKILIDNKKIISFKKLKILIL